MKLVKLKSVILLFFICMLFTSGFSMAQMTELKIGDYVEFGTYFDKPIIWRVIHIDNEGDPLLFSDKIIAFKAFDAKGEKHIADRRFWGSNEWETSNIRQWLNSTENRISWFNNSPSSQNVYYGDFPYDLESGFLSSNNFTTEDVNAIKPVTHKIILSELDKSKKTTGSELHELESQVAIFDVKLNYEKSYAKDIQDRVFLLSVQEVIDYVKNRGWKIETMPTLEAVSKSLHKNYDFTYKEHFPYYLRTPSSIQSYKTRSVVEDWIGATVCNLNNAGIRPATFIDLDKTIISGGKGTQSDAYLLKGTSSESHKFSYSPTPRVKITKSPTQSYPVYVFVNGIPLVSLDAKPFIDSNGRTMVPLKAIGDNLGVNVTWDSTNRSAIVQNEGKEIVLPVNESYGYVNDVKLDFDTQTIIKNNRTYVPLKFVSEQLGYEISYRFDLNPYDQYKTGHIIEVGEQGTFIKPSVELGWENGILSIEEEEHYYSMFRKIPANRDGSSATQVMKVGHMFIMTMEPAGGPTGLQVFGNSVINVIYEMDEYISINIYQVPSGIDEFFINTLTVMLGEDGAIIGTQLAKDIMSVYNKEDNIYYTSKLAGKTIVSGKYTLDYSAGRITWKK